MVEMGKRIRDLRIINDLSQEELGKLVGVQRAAINKYEKGTVINIPLETIEKMAAVFEVSPAYLVGWDDTSTNYFSLEENLFLGIHNVLGKDVMELLNIYLQLSDEGKKRMMIYGKDLKKIYT